MIHLIRLVSQIWVECWLTIAYWYMLLGLRSQQQLVDCTMGEIRVTGTVKVCRRIQLPARFQVTSILELNDDTTVLFCVANPNAKGDLTWISPLHIQIGDERRTLVDSPSHYLDMNEAIFGYSTGVCRNCAEQSGKCSERLKFTVARS